MDSSFSALPSPIMPDGSLCWLPIPEKSDGRRRLFMYDDLRFGDQTVGNIVRQLSRGRLTGTETVHLDPDLDSQHVARIPGWQPIFGQTGAAERHLRNNRVDAGDLFLFFGWFRQTELCDGELRYVRGAPDVHLIYGWLQVHERRQFGLLSDPMPWHVLHPHCQGARYDDLDSVYVPTPTLDLDGGLRIPGAGLFKFFDPALVLTAPGKTRSIWKLPSAFSPNGRLALSYHFDEERWTRLDDHVLVRAASRGQEFVLDLEHYPDVLKWVRSVLIAGTQTRKETGNQ